MILLQRFQEIGKAKDPPQWLLTGRGVSKPGATICPRTRDREPSQENLVFRTKLISFWIKIMYNTRKYSVFS